MGNLEETRDDERSLSKDVVLYRNFYRETVKREGEHNGLSLLVMVCKDDTRYAP